MVQLRCTRDPPYSTTSMHSSHVKYVFMKVRFLMVLATRPFMCPPLWVTWPELTISSGTYIWAVRSPKRKSHAMKMNIELYRHWHHFENQGKTLMFHQITVPWNFTCWWNFILMSWSLAPWSLAHITVCSPSLDVFNSSRSPLHLLPGLCALIEGGRRGSWGAERLIKKRRKWRLIWFV